MPALQALTPYLFFNGNCAEAMQFYQKCLGGDLNMMPFKEGNCPVGAEDKIMHATLSTGAAVLMASDDPLNKAQPSGSFAVSANFTSLAEIERVFAAMSAGATVTQPLQDAFWGARFGMLKDRFGVHWMFNCEKK